MQPLSATTSASPSIATPASPARVAGPTRGAQTTPAGVAANTRSSGPTDVSDSEADVLAAFRGQPHDWLDVGHSRLAYWRFGQGPDLVFVHGWPLHSATFRKLVPWLSSSFTCHLFDLPGTGQTVSNEGAPVDIHSHATTVRSAIDLLRLERYALLAHDSGGLIARMVAADDERVTALVLGNTEIPDHTPLLVVLFALLAKRRGGSDLLGRMLGVRSLRRSFLAFGGCFDDLDQIEGAFHEFFVEPLISSPERARGQMGLLKTIDSHTVAGLAQVHARLRAPSLLIWGAGGPVFPARQSAAYARAIRRRRRALRHRRRQALRPRGTPARVCQSCKAVFAAGVCRRRAQPRRSIGAMRGRGVGDGVRQSSRSLPAASSVQSVAFHSNQ